MEWDLGALNVSVTQVHTGGMRLGALSVSVTQIHTGGMGLGALNIRVIWQNGTGRPTCTSHSSPSPHEGCFMPAKTGPHLTMCSWPQLAAACSGVQPSWSWASTLALCFIRTFTISKSSSMQHCVCVCVYVCVHVYVCQMVDAIKKHSTCNVRL